ncbi:MAG: NUDIX hydrolase [Patescibacteria group bacterium]
MSWTVKKSKVLLKTAFFNVVQEECLKPKSKKPFNYYTLEKSNAAVIMAFTSDKKLILINQYRHPVKSRDYELPAGYVEDYEKNSKLGAARELLEETGYKCKTLKKIGSAYTSAGLMNSKVDFFIGFDAKKVAEQKLDENEDLDVYLTTTDKAMELLQKGKIKDLGSVAGMLMLKDYLANS